MTKRTLYRHGDVMIERIDEIPSTAKETKQSVLADGEATGHAHRAKGDFTLMLGAQHRADSPEMFLRVIGKAEISHEEHLTIELPAGSYRVTQKRQYKPDGWELVRD